MVAEHGGQAAGLGVLHRTAEVPSQAVAVEDVVAQHQRAGLAGGEPLADHERLRQAVGAGLDGVGTGSRRVSTVAQYPLEVGQVGGRNDQDVADAGHHEDRQRVVDHRLVVDRQQLLAGDGGER